MGCELDLSEREAGRGGSTETAGVWAGLGKVCRES